MCKKAVFYHVYLLVQPETSNRQNRAALPEMRCPAGGFSKLASASTFHSPALNQGWIVNNLKNLIIHGDIGSPFICPFQLANFRASDMNAFRPPLHLCLGNL